MPRTDLGWIVEKNTPGLNLHVVCCIDSGTKIRRGQPDSEQLRVVRTAFKETATLKLKKVEPHALDLCNCDGS